jgi:hypothetical protein
MTPRHLSQRILACRLDEPQAEVYGRAGIPPTSEAVYTLRVWPRIREEALAYLGDAITRPEALACERALGAPWGDGRATGAEKAGEHVLRALWAAGQKELALRLGAAPLVELVALEWWCGRVHAVTTAEELDELLRFFPDEGDGR